MFLLAHDLTPDQVRGYMTRDLRGEITTRRFPIERSL